MAGLQRRAAILDAGFKALSTDSVDPFVIAGAPAGAVYRFMGDEHGALIKPGGGVLPLGAVVTLGVPIAIRRSISTTPITS